MINQPTPKQPSVSLKAGHPVTTSLAIAEAFGKQHKDVLRLLKNLECSEEFRRRNFAPAKYFDAQGKPRDMQEVTRDGFIFVGMGFTGAAACAMKEAYITAFNAMEAQLLGAILPRPGQVEALQIQRLQAELLNSKPEWKALSRYYEMGVLTLVEMGKLIGKSDDAVRKHLVRMSAAGIIHYTPDPEHAALIRRGRAQRAIEAGGAA